MLLASCWPRRARASLEAASVVLLLTFGFGCRAQSVEPLPRSDSGSASPEAERPTQPEEAGIRVERVFKDGTMSVVLPPGRKEAWLGGSGSRLEVDVSGAQFVLRTNTLPPHDGESFQKEFGGRILRQEHDAEHSALIVEGATNGPGEGFVGVLGWAPGLLCRGSKVPLELADRVFESCASIRRKGALLGYGERPRVDREPVLGLEGTTIENDFFAISRVKWTDRSCAQLLEDVTKYEPQEAVQTHEGKHGSLSVWESRWPDNQHVVRTNGWAERGEYCCSFSSVHWFERAGTEELEPLMRICDAAATDGWPGELLPPATSG